MDMPSEYYDEDDELSREHWAFDERRDELAKQEEEETKRIEVEKSLHRYTVRYSPPAPVDSWASLYNFLNHFRPKPAIDRMVLNYGIPFALGADLSGMLLVDSVDSNPLDLCLSFNRDLSLDQISKAVQEKMLNSAIKQIDSGHTTLGLKIEEIVSKYPELASRFDDVMNLRTIELEEVETYVGHWKYVDLRGLWLTAYGFEILSALNMDLIITKSDFELVQDAFRKKGLVLKTCDEKSQSYPRAISPPFRELVWWIARHSIKTAWLGNEPRHGWWDYELLQGGPAKFIK